MTSTGDIQKSPIAGPPRRAAYRAASLVWGAALLVGSIQSRRPGDIHSGIAHHVAHLISFGTLAFLAMAGFGDPIRISFWPAAVSFLLGFAIEFLQHWHNLKTIEWYDVRDNAIGIFAFTALHQMLFRRAADIMEGPS